ncbi:helix-turn-helix domain-containing protein [Marinifilum sp. N1E240]|uniref:helix-turn-helix domain-containing protein n=1 Tax=Marinifilum sp. N1E240 TaxID=2608082 RepID=UPI00128E2945|nr:AraC family transcriptional regulator [Marinifilum sp. N1E240]MPQ48975.1 helix-turn-helix domain-containing protein [Marinifilum sp. N1E240]
MLAIRTYQPKQYSDLIERIWILETGDEPSDVIVPPSQYLQLIVPLEGSNYNRNGKTVNKMIVEGISLQTNCVHYPAGTKLMGIRFYPFGMYPFLSYEGKDLLNEMIEVSLPENYSFSVDKDEVLLNEVYLLLEELYDEAAHQKIKILKEYYQTARWSDDSLSIEEYCKLNGTNYTTLNRKFRQITGLSTKKFERLVKFRKSLCKLIDSEDQLTSIGVDSGYFDQAHFIREFKLFLNCTPSTYQSLIQSADEDTKIINYNFRLF